MMPMSASLSGMDDADLFGDMRGRASRAKQLALPLAWRALDRTAKDGILIDDSNAPVARHLAAAASWTGPAAILAGPPRSGKSLFGRIFAATGSGETIDDLTSVAEADIFHAWNRAVTGNHALLIITPSLEIIDAVQLPDLRTRLASAPVLQIGMPEVPLMAALVERLLAERGLAATPQIGTYVAERIDRCYAAVHAVVEAIDALAMATGRPLTIGLARQVLQHAPGNPDMRHIDPNDEVAHGHDIVT